MKKRLPLLILASILLLTYCQDDGADGEQLAKAYCGGCHLYAAPELLDKKSWEKGVLPKMALYLGIKAKDSNPLEGMSYADLQIILEAKVFPNKAVISSEHWQAIQAFYLNNAPDQLPSNSQSQNPKKVRLFQPKAIRTDSQQAAMVTMLKIDTLRQQFLMADGNNQLQFLQSNGQVDSQLKLISPVTDIHRPADGQYYLTAIGHMNPKDQPVGLLVRSDEKQGIKQLIRSLPRPVHSNFADLNQDGLEDVVICGFGYHVGRLSWFEQKANEQYEEHILLDVPESPF
ncbi:MAG: hypothetical protein AAFP19_21505 [Bacteroidota bacterium]